MHWSYDFTVYASISRQKFYISKNFILSYLISW